MTERTPGDPNPTPETQAFWDATADGRFLVRFCRACDQAHWYPRSTCPFCASGDTEWRPGSGQGTIYSFSYMRRAKTPFVMAYVTLAEGPIMMSNIVEADPETLQVGQEVDLVMRSSDGGYSVPCFRPVTA